MNRFFYLAAIFCLFSCSKNPIIIPEFETSTEQYMYARSIQERMLIDMPRGSEKRRYNRVLVKAYQNVTDRFPEDLKVTPLALVNIADVKFREGSYNEAGEIYETALKRYPDQDDIQCKALLGAARSYDRLEEYQKALDYYRQCYERFENDKRPPLSIMGREARYYYSMIRFK